MNNTRCIRPLSYRIKVTLLITCYLFCCCVIVFTVWILSVTAKEAVKQADEATRVAEEAIANAKEAAHTVAYYKEQNKMLVEVNTTLREVLASYDNEFFATSPTPPRYFNVAMPEELQSYIWLLCCNYGIDEHYELIYALIKHESKFDAAAVSRSSDYGLMQINECNHEWLSEELGIVDFLDPYENVHGGIHMIASLLHKYDVPDALMAYNMGENGAVKLWRRGIHSTTYTEQVLDYYKQFTEDI